ncbi:MAG: DUF4906 domain-containing protein [Odoribacteraceae bacterium]|nr:DUF4906 domain-containing protein [Odoribacteraceae bacterium]
MNISRICSLALVALAALSCADEPVGSTGNEGLETTIALSLAAVPEEAPGLAGTRALPDPLEVEEGTAPGYIVKDFWMLQFNENGVRIGAPRYYTMPALTSTTAVAVVLPPANTTYQCVLIANTHSESLGTTLGAVTTLAGLATVHERLHGLADLYNPADTPPDLLMNGTVNVTSSTTSLECTLYRNVAKLTLTINNTAASGVTITSARLRNVPNRLFYADRLLDGATPPSPTPAQSGVFDLPVDTLDLAPGAAVETLRYYLPRNRQGTTGASTEAGKNVDAPARATYVEIMAVTAGAIEDGGGKPLRYRFYPGANMTNDFNIVPNYHYTLPVVFNTAGDVAQDSRVENLGQVQLAGANSYIINPLPGAVQTTYGVPVDRVNRFWGSPDGGVPGGVLSDNTGWVAEVIWQDGGAGVELIKFCEASGVPSGDRYAGTGDSYFYFSPAGPTASGNALIGVRKEDATEYLWSWHVWLTGYNPDEAPLAWQEDVYSYGVSGGHVHRYSGETWATSYADKFIMDRNLGAASADRGDGLAKTGGLYYQFGRKDPFPAATVKLYDVSGTAVTAFTATAGDCIVRVQGGTSIKTAVQRPYTFYGAGSADWVQNNPYSANSWHNPTWHVSPTGKSLFDPCPPGWKLPPAQGTWSTFLLTGTTPNAVSYPGVGLEFYMDGVGTGETAFYPVSGSRSSTQGTMHEYGARGSYWSSAPLNIWAGYDLMLLNSYVTPWNYMACANAISVRCIQE